MIEANTRTCEICGTRYDANHSKDDCFAGLCAENRLLIENLQTIQRVANGELQVANDDTEGMEWIDKYIRNELVNHLK